jgi:hypothetical protein
MDVLPGLAREPLKTTLFKGEYKQGRTPCLVQIIGQ